MKTATPRTDAACGIIHDGNAEWAQTFEQCAGGDYVPADFARKLELEVDNLRVSATEIGMELLRVKQQLKEAQSRYNEIATKIEQIRDESFRDTSFNNPSL